jgi:hypothetical protein
MDNDVASIIRQALGGGAVRPGANARAAAGGRGLHSFTLEL